MGDVGSSGVTGPSGSSSGEAAPDVAIARMDSSLTEGEGGSTEEDDSSARDDAAVAEGEGGDASAGEPLGACCGRPEPTCTVGVCCVASDCPSSERCLHHSCQRVTCATVQDSTYYVDPSAGIDDVSSTGSPDCPFRSLTRALSIIGPDAGAGATVRIVNDGFAPVLGRSTGETLPIFPPANVTIVAEDTTKNLPILRLTPSPVPSDSGLPGYVTGFGLTNPGVNLSYLVVDGNRVGTPIAVGGHAGSIDHVTVMSSIGRGIDVESAGVQEGFVSLGPGVVSQNNAGPGLFLLGFGTGVSIKGGRGIDHTSFSGNGSQGISVRDDGAVEIDGTDIDPAHPDESDVDTDNNVGAGLVIGVFGLSGPTSVVRGLHTSGNTNGIEVVSCGRLKLRGSYTGQNLSSGVYVARNVSNFGGCASSDPTLASLDLGNPTGPDYGRNVFRAPDAGPASSICLNAVQSFPQPPWPKVLAVGNIFGTTDCAVGGTLTRSTGCASSVDVGGFSPDGGPAIDVSPCTF